MVIFDESGPFTEEQYQQIRSRSRKNCGNCHWHDDFTGACFNGDSPHCADFTDDGHLCPQWAEGPPWKETERKEPK